MSSEKKENVKGKNLLPLVLVIKSEVIGVIVASYIFLDWLKARVGEENHYNYYVAGVWIFCGIVIIRLYYDLFRKVFSSIKGSDE